MGGMATTSLPCASHADEDVVMAPTSAAPEPGDDLVQMIVNLLSDKDREMRAVGLQQVREQAKGSAATKRFAALLPKLPPDAQAGLLDALGDRGDPSARPAVLDILKSGDHLADGARPVRAAALRALGSLGEADDVPLLAQSLTAAPGPEKAAARASLIRLRGQAVNAAIVAELKRAKPEVRAELLGVLPARGATESVPVLLEAAKDEDVRVRLAALAALRVLADPNQTAAIINLLKSAKEGPEQSRAELALLAVSARGREACVEAILAGMAGADPAVTTSLLRALATTVHGTVPGGQRALDTIVAATKDQRPAVQAEAVRLLASWPDPAAVPHLLAIARQAEPLGQQAVAVQGLVRQASPRKDRPADMALLREAMKLARRPEEKRMVLGVLGGVATSESLALVFPAMDDSALTDEACLAAILIAENPTGLDRARRLAVLQRVRVKTKDAEMRHRAEALEALISPQSR
jgi:HEAT repeat protein